MRVLVIQTAFIGDVVLTTPLLQGIASKFPSAQIDFIGVKAGCEILSGLPNVHPHVLDKSNLAAGIGAISKKLSGHEYEAVFCVHRSLRSLWLGRMFKAKKRVAFRSVWSVMLGYSTVPYPEYAEEVHYADKPMQLLSAVGAVMKTPKPVLTVDASSEKSVLQKFGVHSGKEYLVISPFSVWGTKMWMHERFAQVASLVSKSTDLHIVLTGGSSDYEMKTSRAMESIIQAEGGTVSNFVGATSLSELKALIKSARVVLTNDSAAIHIASAFDRPTLAIFGPTVKKWGFFPLSSRHIVVENSGLDCRPCSLHGPQSCPKKHFKCMDEISADAVFNELRKLI